MPLTKISATGELPDYLGFGILDRASIHQKEGKTHTRYMSGTDTVYQVTISPEEGELAEFYRGREIGRRVESSLTQAFFLHLAESNIEENPRFAAMVAHIRRDLGLHFLFEPQYVFFPAGFIFTIRFPMMDSNRQPWMSLRGRITPDSMPLKLDKEYPVAILRMSTVGEVTTEHVTAVDCSALMINLVEALDLLLSSGVTLPQEEYRPVVMNATEQGQIRLHPLSGDLGLIAYSVLPLESPTVSLDQAVQKFKQAAQSYRANRG